MSAPLNTDFATTSILPIGSRWKGRLLAAASLACQLALLAAAFSLASAIRADLAANSSENIPSFGGGFFAVLALVLTIKLAIWITLGLHRGAEAWRHTSLRDALRLALASVIGLVLIVVAYEGWRLVKHWTQAAPSQESPLPVTLFILDALISIALLGGARIAARLFYEESRPVAPGGIVRLLIIGAGDAAAAVLREIARMPEQRYRVVGLLDDDPRKARQRLLGVPVLGPISSLPRICPRQQIGEILIALPSASNIEMQRIVSLCRAAQMDADIHGSTGATPLRFRTIPSLQDILAGKAAATQIRDVSVNDVLGRDAVDMDLAAVGAMLHGQVVLVSGAGGSIGSELCRTICRFEPAQLVLLDKAENAIFEIERELKKTWPAVRLVPAIGDITDAVRVDQVFSDYAPTIVFHAAAHKHVPLAESNSGEAIRNNVFGTKTLADAAAAFGIRNFVMISTDKAVNPSSIMGATKRCAEIYIQGLARRAARGQKQEAGSKKAEERTNFITVRFGNVLGSNGSVVPIFKQQIANGGPVTVTHPEMRRYFMTIPEAAQLVLQAGALGNRGEIFVLDMGKPVRILDLARDLIILSGLRPDVDIPIVFTGLRPGEKLYEELSIRGEHMVPTRHPKIAVWKPSLGVADPAAIQRMMDELEPLQHCTDRKRALSTLKVFVPEMKPWEAETTDPAKTQIHS